MQRKISDSQTDTKVDVESYTLLNIVLMGHNSCTYNMYLEFY